MKILAPVDRLDEVALLVESGADELYGGFVPREWDNKYKAVGSINKRTFAEAQFGSAEELRSAIALAHNLGARFFLTLNNDFYSDFQMPAVLKQAELAEDIGIDALIVSDIGLILELRKMEIETELHLSVLAAVLNSGAAGFFKNLGVSRIVLDRSVYPADAAAIIAAEPNVEYEAFMMYGKCPNIEGFCSFFHHNDPEHNWPCGESRGNACALCAYREMDRAGLTAAKIAGRGRKTEDKLAAVRALAAVRDLSESEASDEVFKRGAKKASHDIAGLPCSPATCYFPDKD